MGNSNDTLLALNPEKSKPTIIPRALMNKQEKKMTNHNQDNQSNGANDNNDVDDEVEYAFSKGMINEKHYDLLTKAISNLDSKERDNTS